MRTIKISDSSRKKRSKTKKFQNLIDEQKTRQNQMSNMLRAMRETKTLNKGKQSECRKKIEPMHVLHTNTNIE